jgi:lysozyme family protein
MFLFDSERTLMNIDKLIDDIIGREGGYSDNSADRGGPTKWGVTEAVARMAGWRGDMRDLPRDFAVALYRRAYWQRPGFDRLLPIAPKIAAELFDTGVNMGPSTATGFLQRALNALNRGGRDYADLPPATCVDDTTLAALTAFLKLRSPHGETVLLKALEALQGERYLHLAEARPANEAFLYGWLANRLG